jgi:hypothetical protein
LDAGEEGVRGFPGDKCGTRVSGDCKDPAHYSCRLTIFVITTLKHHYYKLRIFPVVSNFFPFQFYIPFFLDSLPKVY